MADLGITLRDRAIYLPGPDALVIADLHLGRATSSGVAFDLGETTSITDRVRRLMRDFTPATVVLAGDILHDFRRIPTAARDGLETLIETVELFESDLVLVEGNHDARLGTLHPTVPEHALADGTRVCHGHKATSTVAPRYVIGHDHPAIVIEGRRRPCVLVGEGVYRGGDVVALPAFSEVCVGTAVNTLDGGDLASPFLADLEAFRPIVYDPAGDDVLTFPSLGDLRMFL